MNRYFIGASIIAVLILAALVYLLVQNQQQSSGNIVPPAQPTPISTQDPQATRPTGEQAELTGFNFIQNFIYQGPPEPDLQARTFAYQALSENAKQNMSEETLGRDLAQFVGVQDAPDQGASVEDLQIEGDNATLIVGLNYSGARVLRAVNMIIESGEWKVDSIEPLEQ